MPTVEWPVSKVQEPYPSLPVDWLELIEAAALATAANDSDQHFAAVRRFTALGTFLTVVMESAAASCSKRKVEINDGGRVRSS